MPFRLFKVGSVRNVGSDTIGHSGPCCWSPSAFFTSSLIPRKGLHFDNRWSVSTANATTGCHSLSHHTPKGGYTREEQRPRVCCSRPLTLNIHQCLWGLLALLGLSVKPLKPPDKREAGRPVGSPCLQLNQQCQSNFNLLYFGESQSVQPLRPYVV